MPEEKPKADNPVAPPPRNLPTGEVTPVGEEPKAEPERPTPTPPTTADVIPPPVGTPEAPEPEPKKPPAEAPVVPAPEATPPPSPEIPGKSVEAVERRSTIIKLIVIMLMAVGAVGLIIGGVYIYNKWLEGAEQRAITEEKALPPAEEVKEEPEVSPVPDRDGDGIPNSWEEEYGLDPDNPSDAERDKDFDGLTNLEEYEYDTHPSDFDTDKDGYADGEEVKSGYNPKGSGKLEQGKEETGRKYAFIAGQWEGTMRGKKYSFSNVLITLRSDGKALASFGLVYEEENVSNEAVGDYEVNRETQSFDCEMDVQGISESGRGTYLLGFSGNVNSNYDEISGSWYIIPSSLTAPWMTNDRGTFSFKKQKTI
jgi:hypothetical protein